MTVDELEVLGKHIGIEYGGKLAYQEFAEMIGDEGTKGEKEGNLESK